MTVFRPEIPPHIATSIRRFPPDLKRSIKQAIRALSVNPTLRRELEGLWKYRVRRFRIVYEVDRRKRTLRIVAIGHRRQIYEALTSLLRQP